MLLWIVLFMILPLLTFGVILWVIAFNKFHLLQQNVERSFSNIEVIMQKRFDMIMTITQLAKKYNVHENSTIKEATEARGRFTNPDATINERADAMSGLGGQLMKLQAVVERYPELKAELIQSRVLESDVAVEKELANTRFWYNEYVRRFNYRVRAFPTSIIAKIHRFRTYNFVRFEGQEQFVPRRIYE